MSKAMDRFSYSKLKYDSIRRTYRNVDSAPSGQRKVGKKYDVENDKNAKRIHNLHVKKVEQMQIEKQRRKQVMEMV